MASEPPAAVPFAKAHFSGGAHVPVVLKGIANVEGVNRLVAKASLNFCPKALTIVYGPQWQRQERFRPHLAHGFWHSDMLP